MLARQVQLACCAEDVIRVGLVLCTAGPPVRKVRLEVCVPSNAPYSYKGKYLARLDNDPRPRRRARRPPPQQRRRCPSPRSNQQKTPSRSHQANPRRRPKKRQSPPWVHMVLILDSRRRATRDAAHCRTPYPLAALSRDRRAVIHSQVPRWLAGASRWMWANVATNRSEGLFLLCCPGKLLGQLTIR